MARKMGNPVGEFSGSGYKTQMTLQLTSYQQNGSVQTPRQQRNWLQQNMTGALANFNLKWKWNCDLVAGLVDGQIDTWNKFKMSK